MKSGRQLFHVHAKAKWLKLYLRLAATGLWTFQSCSTHIQCCSRWQFQIELPKVPFRYISGGNSAMPTPTLLPRWRTRGTEPSPQEASKEGTTCCFSAGWPWLRIGSLSYVTPQHSTTLSEEISGWTRCLSWLFSTLSRWEGATNCHPIEENQLSWSENRFSRRTGRL